MKVLKEIKNEFPETAELIEQGSKEVVKKI